MRRVYTIDNIILKPVGARAIGTYHTNYWDLDSQNPVNLKFLAAFKAKYGRLPSQFAAQAYDAPLLVASVNVSTPRAIYLVVKK